MSEERCGFCFGKGKKWQPLILGGYYWERCRWCNGTGRRKFEKRREVLSFDE
jgi:hypothetical protein